MSLEAAGECMGDFSLQLGQYNPCNHYYKMSALVL